MSIHKVLRGGFLQVGLGCSALALSSASALGGTDLLAAIDGKGLTVRAFGDGSYSVAAAGVSDAVIRSDVEAVIDSAVLKSGDYPKHEIEKRQTQGDFGAGSMLTITHTGLTDRPDLIVTVTLMRDVSCGEILVQVKNSTHRDINVSSIRSIHAGTIDLGGPAASNRVLSDSFSEDRPQLAIYDLGAAPKGMHRASGSQLIYNRKSTASLFVGALASERFLTLFHLKESGAGNGARIASYDVDATGTTEILREESLKDSPPADRVELRLPIASGDSLGAEPLMLSVGKDYHAQLEAYGRAIRTLHGARVTAATPIGWWSWTAYYFGVNQGAMRTNADWLAQNLKSLGYSFFQIDEGYQYARGEYISADAVRFPGGLARMADTVRHDGLTFGLWTARFEVSERSWVYQNHKDWLVHNGEGNPIHIGYVTEKRDHLFALDATNPGAQEYLRQTYTTLRDWGVRFIKMDFMDDTAIEGSYFRRNTTAMEAQRIGLKIIRSAVGEDVVLDKDGSPMLNPVGIVDSGRISQDTGHTFEATRDAASGVAARYFMDRNFFISDPDAFTVSLQTVDDQSWHGGQRSLTLDEAKVSIALAAVSGGMLEIGDDLPTLGASPERLALVKNADVLDMAKLGRASVPVDLMSYAAADEQPSLYLLKEDPHQAILTVFNWTEQARARAINLEDLGLKSAHGYSSHEVFGDADCCAMKAGSLSFMQPPHSVRVIKLLDSAVPASVPAFEIHSPASGTAGATLAFSAKAASTEAPVLGYRWEFGDGTITHGSDVAHTYTHAGVFQVVITSTGLASATDHQTVSVNIAGENSTRFDPAKIQRAQ
jgi:hypothetical protein